MKKLVISLLIVTLLITNSHIAYAQELSNSASYDLELGGTQTFYLENENGEIETVTIEALSDNTRAIDNSYKVNYKAAGWEAGFYIQIVAKQIIKAYSPYHFAITGSITNASLTHNDGSRATYSFLHEVALILFKTGVVVTINDNTIKVSKMGLSH